MRLIVVIASAGRRDILRATLKHLQGQERLPDEIVISAVAASDIPEVDGMALKLRVLLGPQGLCAQRNTALADVLACADIIAFFDDDFLPAQSYLARLERAFAENDDFSVIHGDVIADGIGHAGFSVDQGLALLRRAGPGGDADGVCEHRSAYGCNMSIRAARVGALRFDERLALYGWQEDADFTAQLGRTGRVVQLASLRGVHLGVKSGRVSGRRLGYSQIVNPLYLVRKGTMPPRAAAKLMVRNMAANVARSIVPEPWIDRRGRLYGNLIGISHILKGRIEPEHVLRL